MAQRGDVVKVAWVKLRGSNCPAYPVSTTVDRLRPFIDQLQPGDAILISSPMPGETEGSRSPTGPGSRDRTQNSDSQS